MFVFWGSSVGSDSSKVITIQPTLLQPLLNITFNFNLDFIFMEVMIFIMNAAALRDVTPQKNSKSKHTTIM